MPTCRECGAALPEGGTCRDHFHALLLLESEIPGGPGERTHFLAVASYNLQHPDSMNFTAGTLAGLLAALADVLDGRLEIRELRRRMGRELDGPARVTRRAGDAEVAWRRGGWTMTGADVAACGAEGYEARVEAWARSVRAALDADGGGAGR